jgi:hypothetical protein
MKVLVLLAAAALCASAAPITIVYTGSGSGSLDGVPFTTLDFNILATANTTDVQTGAGFARVSHTSASIELPGIGGGIFQFTVPTSTIILNGGNEAIFAYGPPGTHLIVGYNDPALGAYDLLQPGLLAVNDPFVALIQWNIGDPVTTDGGRLIFDDAAGFPGLFSVSIGGDGGGIAPIPEPSTLVLLALPLAAVVALRARRQKSDPARN